ncbi:His-Xaa-Ser repeat protein HxsA [Vibrio splendidus]|uniref:His-Xaa-Ser repeat protein HxsA n=1 Tax=Vibrio splendidus TaxID=29497 RepID=UPI000C858231|nr:His-Xaa-Ser repeat protein HxsA [Vibrio splendidus]PMH05173.1 His-Xaa-Ser repeat protein HxsA [Vibrio splendidus]
MKRNFNLAALLPGFFALNSGADAGTAAPEEHDVKDEFLLDKVVLAPLNEAIPLYIAAHRSHRSHSSHRSSAGATYSAPVKKQKSQPLTQPSTPSYTAPATKPPVSTVEELEKRKELIIRVQFALYTSGYYKGIIDGIMGKQTRKALNAYRVDNNIPVSQTLDTVTLNSLGILAR